MFGSNRKSIRILISPGSGADEVDVDIDSSLQDFVNKMALQQHQINVNGQPIAQQQYSSMRMGEVDSLWASLPVKGA